MKRRIRIKRAISTSVQIRPQVARMLERFIKKGLSKNEMINEALRQYLLEKEFQEIRVKMLPEAQAKGLYTDEDIERFLK